MSVSGINNYTASGTSGASSSGSTSGSNYLSMDDFLSLLVAQMSNQDMYNTMDDSQFISQMAQFSMIQAMTELTQASAASYGVSLIGKEVVLAQSKSDGTIDTIRGIVEGVNLYNGSTEIVVDGNAYALSSIMIVKEPDIIIPDSDVKDSSGNNTDNGTTDNGNTGGSEEDDTNV
ncbi:flagellar hook capping FlgD N-terminal domain-containing protein [Sinanaerobacter chloroacetimidivorans]|uniref:Flagellar basal-body rod modification protein FlgD n=1 Tax=Sinanaerobacter chloroacetimidivorans TaxID=2818044 RepID=A0A8J8B0U8_9FIRM|nr:flagellar hook capping FlgD N-terminal domain-containing protein [Sinanaerobacter chloroacetimidivorans]MBR0597534.1 hypothetical protein [Sinanaerobacter chloroacetimidivorans]